MSSSTVDLVDNPPQKLELEDRKLFKNTTNSQRISYIIKFITVEPILLGYLFPTAFCSTALNNLTIEKTCLANLKYNDSICQAILIGKENFTKEKLEIYEVINEVHAWIFPLEEVVPIILILFLGPFSDLHKMRKPFLILPIIGEFFAVTGCMLSVVYMKEWTIEVQIFFQTVVPSFTGAPSMFFMIIMAYIADTSSVVTRTLRLSVSLIIYHATAELSSGLLFRYGGYFGSFCVADCCFLFSLLYTIFLVKEPKKTTITSKKSLILSFFNPKHALETFKLPFKKSPGNNRQFIALVIVITLLTTAASTGDGQLLFLYLQKVFNWTAETKNYFDAVNLIISSIGSAIGISIFIKIFKISDLVIAVIACLFWILYCLIIALAKASSTVYFACATKILIGLWRVALSSFRTKVVSEDKLATAQSLFSICEYIAYVAGSNVFNIIYIKSVEEFSSLFWYVEVLLLCICILLFLWMYFMSKKMAETPENSEPTEKYRSTVM